MEELQINNKEKEAVYYIISVILFIAIGIVSQNYINYLDEHSHYDFLSYSNRENQYLIMPFSLFLLIFLSWILSIKGSYYRRLMRNTFIASIFLLGIYTFGLLFLIGLGSGNK